MKSDKNAPVSLWAILDDRADYRTDKYEEEWNGFWQFFNVMQFSRGFVAVSRSGLDNHVYDALPYGQNETAAEDNKPVATAEDWAQIREMLFDDEAVKMADLLEGRGMAAPEEAGYELVNETGEVIAEIELAWINRKIGYMTEAQIPDRNKAEKAGWKIFTSENEIDIAFGEG